MRSTRAEASPESKSPRLATVVHIDHDGAAGALLRREMACWPEVRHIGMAQDAETGLEMCLVRKPSVVLLDIFMHDRCGLGLLERLAALKCAPRVIIYTWLLSDVALSVMSSSFVSGIVIKGPQSVEEMRVAVNAMIVGGRYIPTHVTRLIRASQSRPDAYHKIISPREQELLAVFGRGLNDAEAGMQLGISEATVHIHRQNIMTKLGLHTAKDLCLYAISNGFSPPPLSAMTAA